MNESKPWQPGDLQNQPDYAKQQATTWHLPMGHERQGINPNGLTPQQRACLEGKHESGGQVGLLGFVFMCKYCQCLYVPHP